MNRWLKRLCTVLSTWRTDRKFSFLASPSQPQVQNSHCVFLFSQKATNNERIKLQEYYFIKVVQSYNVQHKNTQKIKFSPTLAQHSISLFCFLTHRTSAFILFAVQADVTQRKSEFTAVFLYHFWLYSSSCQYFKYIFPDGVDTVIVKVNSDMNFPCSVMSIQDIQVPTSSTQYHNG